MTTEQKIKSEEFLSKLHDKYYGKKKSKAGAPKASAKLLKKPKAHAEGPSRNELMSQAKARGIKNFRVLDKSELVEILKEGTTKERISEIVVGAVARWKSGWGTRKQKSQK